MEPEPTNWWPPPNKKELRQDHKNFATSDAEYRWVGEYRDLFAYKQNRSIHRGHMQKAVAYEGVGVHEGKCWHVWYGRYYERMTDIDDTNQSTLYAFCFRKTKEGEPRFMFRTGMRAERLLPRKDLKRR